MEELRKPIVIEDKNGKITVKMVPLSQYVRIKENELNQKAWEEFRFRQQTEKMLENWFVSSWNDEALNELKTLQKENPNVNPLLKKKGNATP